MSEYTRKRTSLLVKPQWDAVAKHDSKGSFSLVESSSLNNNNGTTLALQFDDQGKPRYDQVITQNMRKGKIAYTRPSDQKEKNFTSDQLMRPSDDTVQENLAKTKEALQLALSSKNTQMVQKSESEIFRYTPNQKSEVGQRLIKMTTRVVDPLEPSNIRHKKMPANPPSPPAAVLHSPPRKLTKEDQMNWKIPPCVSNWKNQKGYTLPIDKRVQADGRRLREVVINDKFASLSESLFIAERTAREEVRMRNEIIREEKLKEAKKREDELRELAAKAREERHQLYAQSKSKDSDSGSKHDVDEDDSTRSGHRSERKHRRHSDDEDERDHRRESRHDREDRKHRRDRDDRDGRRHSRHGRRDRSSSRHSSDRTDDTDEERRELLKIEAERRRELEREWRLEKGIKKRKTGERDVSEKIALGQAKPTKITDLYDARLLQGDAGMSSGFDGGDDEGYNVYDKPLFADRSTANIYQHSKERFTKSTGGMNVACFANADRGVQRNTPVEFVKDPDPFGFEKLLQKAKKT
ncbi:chromatin-binding protein [Theileria orientalis]|uniref:Chromatin-binding protein n=1 Tax=Theileria orientalis TaxID=68886 RepID=A0A976QTP9_THEOR|nr:chromatin-binding protein [Theileria orientalis]